MDENNDFEHQKPNETTTSTHTNPVDVKRCLKGWEEDLWWQLGGQVNDNRVWQGERGLERRGARREAGVPVQHTCASLRSHTSRLTKWSPHPSRRGPSLASFNSPTVLEKNKATLNPDPLAPEQLRNSLPACVPGQPHHQPARLLHVALRVSHEGNWLLQSMLLQKL